MEVTILLLSTILTTTIRIIDAQTCSVYTAGSKDTNQNNVDTNAAIYVNRRTQEEAKCSGTVYAWYYCYYPDNSETNLQVAFGVFSFTNMYTLRNGSYHLLHLDMRESVFTCDTLTLNPSEYFQIQEGDRVGACLKQNGDVDYLDILRLRNRRVHSWAGDGSCTESDVAISPIITNSHRQNRMLHLYVDINIDECAVGVSNCHPNALCSDIVGSEGSFQCSCNTGYSGDGVNCNNIDECATGMDNCAEQAICADLDGSFSCTCNNGYMGNGMICNDIDECATDMDNCADHATCVDTEGSYSCTCNAGYTGDGTECIDVDECDIGMENCDANAGCTNSDGSYTCSCLSGYSGDGAYCYYVDECTTDMDNCSEKATCADTDGSFLCTCNDGYTGYGVVCHDVDECEDGSDICDVNADCINTNGSYFCSCKNGYSGNGLTCTDVDECQETVSMCGMNANCTNTEGSYKCTCTNGFTGDGSNCSDVDECVLDPSVCESRLCVNTEGSYECICPNGYIWNETSCNDMDECLWEIWNNCSVVADCINTAGSYSCQCKPGYGGDGTNCSDVDECSWKSNDCSKNAECVNTDGGYYCQCTTGYTGNGKVCEALPDVREPEEQKTSDPGSNLGLISGVTVAGLLVVATLLITGVLCGLKFRMRSKSANISNSLDFENRMYGVGKRNTQMSIIIFNNGSYETAEAQHRDLDNPIYDGIMPQGEQESELNSDIYDTPQDLKQGYMSDLQCSAEGNVYDNPTLLQGLHSPTENSAPLEYYSAVDYYSTLNYMEEDYDDIIRKAEKCGGAVEEDSANLYYSPAEREDELYEQLQKQKIKSIPSSHIKKLGILGSGEFGTVCKGEWVYADKKLNVAIKVLSDASDETSKVKFLQEAAIMSQFRHPNVIKLYGVVSDGQEIMLIVELLEKGDLRQALNKMRPDPGQLHATDLPPTLLAYSRQTALGMVYLSGKGFVHRDLAARNILLSHNNICKICDFGMSRDLEEENYYMSQGGKVPVKWTAPEALAYKKYSTASDVWSYGCLLYEIWSLGHKPFEGYTNREVVQQVETGYRLPPPPGCPEAVYNLMIDCWHPKPAERPKFQKILLTLLGDDKALLAVPTEERATHSLAGVLGSPLEAGHGMYLSKQNVYHNT